MYGCVLSAKVTADVGSSATRAGERGIHTRAFFAPLHRQKPTQQSFRSVFKSFEVARLLGNRGFYLPSGISLENERDRTYRRTIEDILNGL